MRSDHATSLVAPMGYAAATFRSHQTGRSAICEGSLEPVAYVSRDVVLGGFTPCALDAFRRGAPPGAQFAPPSPTGLKRHVYGGAEAAGRVRLAESHGRRGIARAVGELICEL